MDVTAVTRVVKHVTLRNGRKHVTCATLWRTRKLAWSGLIKQAALVSFKCKTKSRHNSYFKFAGIGRTPLFRKSLKMRYYFFFQKSHKKHWVYDLQVLMLNNLFEYLRRRQGRFHSKFHFLYIF